MTINFIGSGNLAWHLSKALQKAGYTIGQIVSNTVENSRLLAEKLDCNYTNDLEKTEKADLFIISVSDIALPKICDNKILKKIINNSSVVHTAGSINVNILKGLSDSYGVFYPLQTFSKQKTVSFKNIPVCIEANNNKLLSNLQNIASNITNDVRFINSTQREIIHLSAVFACNFTNYMYAVSEKILQDKNVDFDILLPLIKETYEKAIANSPAKVQTGPAKRNDKNIIQKHEYLLEEYPNFKDIYTLLSKNISDAGNNKK